MTDRVPPGGRACRCPDRSRARAQRLRRNPVSRAGQQLSDVWMRLRPPGETSSTQAGHPLAAPVFRSVCRRHTRQVLQLAQPDLVTRQELGAPPSQSALGVLAHQGQALSVGEGEDAPSSAHASPGGQRLTGARRRRRAVCLGGRSGLDGAGASRQGQQHRGRIRAAPSPSRLAPAVTPATAPMRPLGVPGTARSTPLQEGD